MKVFFKYSLFIGLLILSFSCRESEMPNPEYDGGTFLHFSKGTVLNETVLVNTNYKDVTIYYGSMLPANGSHDVKLEVVSTNSGTVLGTDFEIISTNDNLAQGETEGSFVVRIYEPAMGEEESVVFKLNSSTMPMATYNQTFTLNWTLQCTLESFLGDPTDLNFNVKYQFFQNATYPVQVIEGTEPNTLILKDYFEAGYDIEIEYNPSTGRYSAAKQPTGYMHATYGMVYLEIDDEEAYPSMANYCNRTMTLRPYLSVSAGYFDGMPASSGGPSGVQPFTDIFTGL